MFVVANLEDQLIVGRAWGHRKRQIRRASSALNPPTNSRSRDGGLEARLCPYV